MQNAFKHRVLSAAIVLGLSCAAAIAQNLQPAKPNSNGQSAAAAAKPAKAESGGPAPVHDFNGTWIGAAEAQLSNRIPQMTPAGAARLKLNIPDPFSASSNDPWRTCDPFGMPRATDNEIREIGFAQMPDRIIILENYDKAWREVWMDGRQLPKNIGQKGGPSPLWYGYSVGHWDGDNTLVVDTTGIDDKTWMDRRGYPHSVGAHIQERYTRSDHNHLSLVVSVDDPAFYTSSFVLAKADYKWIQGQDNTSVAIPFSDEEGNGQICIPSQIIEYNKLMGEQADEDSVTGYGKQKQK